MEKMMKEQLDLRNSGGGVRPYRLDRYFKRYHNSCGNIGARATWLL